MPNANIKQAISFLTTVALIFIAGCSSPEERRAKSLAEAAQLKAAGEVSTALDLLEALSQKFPDDSEILQQIGLAHQELGNYSEAAFYLGAAHNLSPDNQELIYQAYLAYEIAGQQDVALDLLELFAQVKPKALTSEQWFRLGELSAQAKKTETALKAYLEGVKLTDKEPSPEIALAIGTQFKQLDNLPMAGRWLAIAAKSDDPSALQALFGILEIHLRSKNWEAAEKSITLLDKKFPGALDASEWASARAELKKWRANQAEMKQQIRKIAQSEQTQEESPDEKTLKPSTVSPATATTTPVAAQPEISGKAQVVADMATAEALVNKPARETIPEKTPETVTKVIQEAEPTESTSAIVFNPNVIIQPAEPYIEGQYEAAENDFGTDVHTGDVAADADGFANDKTTAPVQEPEILVDYDPPSPDIKTQPQPDNEPAPLLPDTSTLSFEEIIAAAKEAASTRNYEKAAHFYRNALERQKNRADIWNDLSKIYFIAGQANDAATAALEATRLAPEKIQYVLDYLRAAQRAKKPIDFIKELEIAYDRFPRSPEITLSLARGYTRIGGNDYAASILYRRFIQLAPRHPLRSEAEAALARNR